LKGEVRRMYNLLVATSIDPDRPFYVEFETAGQRATWRTGLSGLMREISSDLEVKGDGITARCWFVGDSEPSVRIIRPQDFSTEVRRQFHDIYDT
jgi:hypothetical protein